MCCSAAAPLTAERGVPAAALRGGPWGLRAAGRLALVPARGREAPLAARKAAAAAAPLDAELWWAAS